MDAHPVTIDNLGIDASRTYAKNQELLDKNLRADSLSISKKTEISVISPYLAEGEDRQFAVGVAQGWVVFSLPKNYGIDVARLFTYQLAPSLGSQEEEEAIIESLSLLEGLNPLEEVERKKILSCLKMLKELRKLMEQIIGRCNQFHRG